MSELSPVYLNEFAKQIIFISVFLGGFSATILANLILSHNRTKTLKRMIVGTAISSTLFIVAVFAMTQVVMKTLPDSPLLEVSSDFARKMGSIAFFAGFFSLIYVLAISGWMQSKKLGVITTIIGIIGGILALLATLVVKI